MEPFTGVQLEVAMEMENEMVFIILVKQAAMVVMQWF
jgi:hypothetical protein